MDILVSQMMEKQGITEELKARDQMEWVRAVTADKALGRAHEPRRGYHCLIYQVVSKCALRDEKLLVSTSVRFF